MKSPAENNLVSPLAPVQDIHFISRQLLVPDPGFRGLILHIDGPLNVKALESAVVGLTHKHPALRMTIRNREGRVQMAVEPPLVATDLIEYIDAQGTPKAQRVDVIQSIHLKRAKNFDIAVMQHQAWTLFTWTPTEHALLLSMHHIFYDGVSWLNLLPQDFCAFYERALRGDTSAPPVENRMAYFDYVQRQRQRHTPERLVEHLDFWRRYLGGANFSLNLTTDYPIKAQQTYQTREHHHTFSEELTARARALAETAGEPSRVHDVFFVAMMATLSKFTHQKDLTCGFPVHGRTRQDSDIFGCFVNTIPRRLRLSADSTFIELVQKAGRDRRSLKDHQHIALASI
ncbi:MAG: condensation domain-containing protein, partial [Myxococcota bacterium]